MDKQELAVITERCEQATPGPWELRPYYIGGREVWNDVTGNIDPIKRTSTPVCKIRSEFAWNQGDKQFIAHARTDIPDLIAEIDRLQAERDAYGCEFCLDDADNEPESIGTGLNEFGQECKYLMVNDEPVFEIKYCPMCGKGLEGRG